MKFWKVLPLIWMIVVCLGMAVYYAHRVIAETAAAYQQYDYKPELAR
jgi:hypothetical protein